MSAAIADVLRAMRSASDDVARLAVVKFGAAQIERAGDDDAFGELSDAAIFAHELDPDDVQAAIQAGAALAWEERGGIRQSTNGVLTMSSTTLAPIAYSPTPYAWRDPATIPPREWLYGHQLIRKFVSALIAPGGVGKSTKITCDALAMTSGRPLLGVHPHGRLRVWLWNGEDPADELDRRLAAVALHHRVNCAEIDGWLWRDSGRDTPIKINVDGTTAIAHPVISGLIAAIRERRIDVLIVDPFVSVHSLPENGNNEMDAAVKAFAFVADKSNCAIELVHHVRKLNGADAGIDDARGAGAIAAAVRAAQVLNVMSSDIARTFDIADSDRRQFVRIDDAKANLAPPAAARWLRLISQPLGNATDGRPEDFVAVPVEWRPPDTWADATVPALNAALDDIDAGLPDGRRYSHAPNATDRAAWAVVQRHCQGKPEAQCRNIVNTWVRTGLLVVQDYDDPVARKPLKGLLVDHAKRPS